MIDVGIVAAPLAGHAAMAVRGKLGGLGNEADG
jgi:hypothetical protein